ncbi:MAG: RNA polymerase sporulation sigma factor SigE [Clostridia bacterium]|nr:RNA polymerase sporulation sigma factor SigE [Clostridia bacterium]
MGLLSRIRRFFTRVLIPEEICYINGADVLPPPLAPEEEREAIRLSKTDDRQRSLLIEHNLRLVVFIAKKFDGTGVGIEDLISIGTMGLMKAISTFSPDKNIKLATYASRCIENEILMFLRKTAGQKREVSFDEPLNVDWDGNELLLSDVLGSEADSVCRPIEEQEERTLVRRSVARLSERERTIVELRFGLRSGREMTQKEVADRLGISQSYISRLEKKIMARLRHEIGDKI